MLKRFFHSPIPVIIIAALMRLVPHPANVAPIGAMALFSGSYLPKKYALIIPLAAMIISDFFLGFHSTIMWVYGSFLLIGLLGMQLRNKANAGNVFLATAASSLLFYFVTNFGVWISTEMYPKTWEGLLQCYVMGLPFLRNTVIGDGLYSAVLFGGYYIVSRSIKPKFIVSSSQ